MAAHNITFTLPTKVTFGCGSLPVLGEEVLRSDFKRVALITSQQLVELNLVKKVTKILEKSGCKVLIYSEAENNPTAQLAAKAVHSLDAFAPDCLIGFGGGSAIDLAKAVGICLSHRTQDIRTFLKQNRITRRSIPVICIPTTAGTGSEANYWAVISDSCTREKLSIGNPRMAPHMAIVDPELTLTLPPKLTLWTGIDAFTHALEAYTSILSNRFSDLLALEALKLTFENLERAVEQGNDLEAREGMALASLLAGAAMQQVGLGLVHAMSHQISGFYNSSHGLTNAKLLRPVFTFNLPKIPAEKRSILDSLRDKPFQDVLADMGKRYSFDREIINVHENDLLIMSQRAAENVNARTNPRDANASEIETLYQLAFTVS